MIGRMNEHLSRTFLGQTIQRVGVRQASNVMTYALAWWTVHADLGHEPTSEEYAVWWKVSASTAYRELRAFREAWPEFSTPTDVAVVLGVDLSHDEVPNPATALMPAGGVA